MKQNKINASLLPNITAGIILCVVYAVGSLVDILIQTNNSGEGFINQSWSNILKLAVVVYYFICIYRYHTLLKEITDNNYPISPGKAVGFHFIPFYNLYWAVKWTNSLADFINNRHPDKPIARGLGGVVIIITFIISLIPIPGNNTILFIGGAITPLLWFLFFLYINNRFKTINDTDFTSTAEAITLDQQNNHTPMLNDTPISGHSGIGWALLSLPLLFLLFTIIIPTGQTIALSFSKWNMLGPMKSIGFANYLNLFNDPKFMKILVNTFLSTVNLIKLAIVVCVPLFIAFLINNLGRNKESVPRVLTVISLIGASSLGIALAIGGIFRDNFNVLMQYDGALHIILMVADLFFTLSIALVPGVILFLGIMKGKSLTGQSVLAPGVGLFIVTIIAYGFQTFLINNMLSHGIGVDQTDNLVNYSFKVAMKMFRLGSGAAMSVLLFLPLLLCGILVWIIMEKNGLKFRPINNSIREEDKVRSPVLPIFIILPFAALILGIVIYHLTQAFKNPEAFLALNGKINFGGSFILTMITLIVITALQLGISFMGGYALGKLRFRGQKIITFLMCCFLFFTPNILFISIFINFKFLGMINTVLPFILSLVLQPFGILLFKVYFEGERLEEARFSGNPDNKEIKTNFNTSRGMMCLFISSLLIIYNINQVIIPFISISLPKNQMISTIIMELNIALLSIPGAASAGWLLGLFPFTLAAVVLMIIPQILFFPNMCITSDKKRKNLNEGM